MGGVLGRIAPATADPRVDRPPAAAATIHSFETRATGTARMNRASPITRAGTAFRSPGRG
ncbi:MAG: hypothetical protein EBZ59_06350 [Planctomycetia bacterium]|nr:hypothetical protein [Planctomycetia bacterium]